MKTMQLLFALSLMVASCQLFEEEQNIPENNTTSVKNDIPKDSIPKEDDKITTLDTIIGRWTYLKTIILDENGSETDDVKFPTKCHLWHGYKFSLDKTYESYYYETIVIDPNHDPYCQLEYTAHGRFDRLDDTLYTFTSSNNNSRFRIIKFSHNDTMTVKFDNYIKYYGRR